jgi:hypothetical protein
VPFSSYCSISGLAKKQRKNPVLSLYNGGVGSNLQELTSKTQQELREYALCPSSNNIAVLSMKAKILETSLDD